MKWSVELGDPLILGNLLIVPIKGEGVIEVIPLDEGYGKGVRIKETGKIDRVILENPTDEDVFVMDGEEFLGARQDRIALASAVIEANSSVNYPVLCIEKGRWEGEEEIFGLGYTAFPKLRALLTFNRGTTRSLQETVWAEVETKLSSLKVSSQTMSMHDSFKAYEKEIESYTLWEPDDDTVGIMGFSARGFLCCDIFGSPSLFRKLKNKLLSGYALDALEDRLRGRSFSFKTDRLKEIFQSMLKAEEAEEIPSIGRGKEVRLISDKVRGKALLDGSNLVHATFFPAK